MYYRINIIRFLMLLLITIIGMQGITAQELEERDQEAIKRQAKFLVEEFQKLLINLSNENNTEADIEKIIFNNIKGDKIFWNEDITIEDDLNPKFIDYENPIDKRVEDYLKDFDIYYTKGPTSTIQFDSLSVSEVMKSEEDFWFVKVIYLSRFLNRHKDFLVPYPSRKRVAEIRAEPKEVGFNTYILSVRYYDEEDTTEYGEFDFLPEVIEEKFQVLQDQANEWLSRGAYAKSIDLLKEAYLLKGTPLVDQTIRSLEDRISNIETRRQYFDIDGYNEYLENNKDEDAYVGRGLLYMENKDYPAAIADFEKAIEINPKLLDAYIYRSEAMREMGNFFSAAQSLEEAQQLDPSNLDLAYEVAYIWHLQGNYLNEIDVLSQAIAQFPEEPKLYELRSRARLGLRNYRSTAEDLQVLTYLEQDSAIYWYQLGNVFLLQQDTLSADSVFTIADSLNERLDRKITRLTARYIGRAKRAFQEERYMHAIDTLNEIVLLDPSNLDAYLLRGKACVESGFTTFAITDLTEVLSREENAEAYLYRGRAALKLNNINEAKSDLRAAITTDRYLCDTYMLLGEIHVAEDEYEDAVNRFNQGLMCRPNQPKRHLQLAKLHYDHEAYSAAETSARKAIALKEDMPEAYLVLGRAQIKQNKYREAIQQYENVVKYDEFNPEAYIKLAEFYETYYGMNKRAEKYRARAEELQATIPVVRGEEEKEE